MQRHKKDSSTLVSAILVAVLWSTACVEEPAVRPQAVEPSTSPGTSMSVEPLTLPDLWVTQPLTNECCTTPGSASECWMSDAEEDGVLCSTNAQCPSGSCNTAKGRCRCSADPDCRDGVCMDGLCGPSWCNGYLVCSCWGGCEWWAQDRNMTLHDLAASQGLYCCEGIYARDPTDIDPALGGTFSAFPCGGCHSDVQCNDNNPCTENRCVSGACTAISLNGDVSEVPSAAQCPFDDAAWSPDCAKRRCNAGTCAVDVAFNAGGACSRGPDAIPENAHTDCFTGACGNNGVCQVTLHTGSACRVGENSCADARCDAAALCVDAPLNDAGLQANALCCDPDKPASFDDGHPCTDDYCCYPGHASASCQDILAYHQRNVPNYNPANPGNCCEDSYHCYDANACTRNICCNVVNRDHPACGEANWECAAMVEDLPGCCDLAPPNLADNCEDAYACTRNRCCDPASVAAAGAGDPCFSEKPYTCAAPAAFDVLPAGCCDPSRDNADCDDGNICTVGVCNPATMTCRMVPQPLFAGCCGPGAGGACADDGNACTEMVCCDAAAIAAAEAGDACFGKQRWHCDARPLDIPGCCTDASECDDGNACTENLCVNNQCQWREWENLTEHPGCCNVASWDSAQCTDANDPGNCTQNVCCSPLMAAAAAPGDPCFGRNGWSCDNPVRDPLPLGCCTPATVATNCNPDGNVCALESCSNFNCHWQDNPAGAPMCCSNDGQCPSAGPARPCLESAACDTTGNPLTNSDYGQCQLTFRAEGTVCGVSNPCFSEVCGDPVERNFACTGQAFVPAFGEPGAVECASDTQCAAFWCDGNGVCGDRRDITTIHDSQRCDSVMNIGSGATLWMEATNECGVDDFAPFTQGRFAACDVTHRSDVVYAFGTSVTDDYDLSHRVVTVADQTGGRDYLIYARRSCDDPASQQACNDNCVFDGSNYNPASYGGFIAGECDGAESTVVTGPFAVTDVPNHPVPLLPLESQDFDRNSVRDGYDVVRDHTSFVVVDSRPTNPHYGGEFELGVSSESHNNNDCRQIASYSGPPVIDGSFTWKQRWRGTMNAADYVNYFGAGGPAMGLNGARTATNPHQAFFKLDLPADSGKYLAYVDWYGLRKRGESGYAPPLDAATTAGDFFHATLSHLDRDPNNPNACSGAAGNVRTTVHANELAPQIELNTDENWAPSWLAVANRIPDAFGDYEVSLIRAPQPFFGFYTGYSTQAKVHCGTLDVFDGESTRLDLIPSGTARNGYLVTVTHLRGGLGGPDQTTCAWTNNRGDNLSQLSWLVSPDCYAPAAAGGLGGALTHTRYVGAQEYQVWARLPFKFPIAGDFHDVIYYDTTGRVEPRQTYGACNNDPSCNKWQECKVHDCMCVSALNDQCVTKDNGYIYEPTPKDIFYPPEEGGRAPVIAAAWGAFDLNWNRDGNRGYMTAQTVVFEGTLAYVISWVGMDVSDRTGNFTKLPPTRVGGLWTGTDWADYRNRANFQVILRIDGRITLFYGPSLHRQVWDEVVERGAFVIAASGGLGEGTCNNHAACAVYGPEARCDNTHASSTRRCYRRVSPLIRDENTGDLLPGLGNE